ncbi:MAG: TolC family protein [Candidatus Omnitrophota bacterium]
MNNFFLKLLIVIIVCSLHNRVIAEEMLTWHDCIKEAAKNNPDLIAAEEQVRQSQAAKTITASTLYPQLNTNVNAARAESAPSSTSANSRTTNTFAYGLTASQLLFDGLKTINSVRAATETIKAFQENFRFTSAAVRFKLRSAFINLLTAQEMLRIAQEIYDIRKKDLKLITLQYLSGLEHKGALLTAEADAASANYNIVQAERELKVAQRELIKEMGWLEFKPIRVDGNFEVKDSAKQKPNFENIAKNNPSLKEAIAQVDSAGFSLKSTYGSFFPTISGNAGINKTGAHWPAPNRQWNAGVALSLPLFEGGLRMAQVAQAKAFLRQLKENQRSTEDSIIVALEQAWAELQDALDLVEVERKYLIANEERSKIAQAQYSTGFISFDNWIIIEDNLVRSKKAFLDIQASALLAEANWIQAKGETLEYE